MNALQTLEAKAPGSGHAIQGVLQGLGVQNINNVQPPQYPAFYAGVEALLRG